MYSHPSHNQFRTFANFAMKKNCEKFLEVFLDEQSKVKVNLIDLLDFLA